MIQNIYLRCYWLTTVFITNFKVMNRLYLTPVITLLVAAFSLSGLKGQALSGTYTIAASGGNYNSFNAAVSDLVANGVSDSVTFLVSPGTYTEQVSITSFSGASPSHIVKFISSSGNAADVILRYQATGSYDNYTLRFSGSNYVQFSKITIQALGTSYGKAVVFSDGAGNISVDHCSITLNPTNSSTSELSGFYSGNTIENNIVIAYNDVKYGSYGVLFESNNSSNKENSNVIANNTFTDNRARAISVKLQTDLLISGNDIDLSSSSSAYGIYAHNIDNPTIKNNIIKNANYGIYLSSVKGTYLTPIYLTNNMVAASSNGIYLSSCEYMNVYHNSVYHYGNSGQALKINYGNGNNIKNNIFASFNGAYAYTPTAAGVSTMDYNDLYTNGCILINSNGGIEDLAAWQVFSGFDLHSISKNPRYVSQDDLHSAYIFLDNAGANLIASVPTDIDGDPRSNPPCIGADEFTASPVSPLSGTYTIPGDYSTIQAALDDAYSNGISGQVTFQIANGTYNEQLSFQEIDKVNSGDKITIESASGQAGDVNITFATTSAANNYVIHIYNTGDITFKNVTISAVGLNYGTAVLLERNVNDINFSNCVIQNTPTTSTSDVFALVHTQNANMKNLTFQSDTFKNGSYGLYLINNNGCDKATGLEVSNNTFLNNYYTGISINQHSGYKIDQNTFLLDSTYSSNRSIYVSSTSGVSEITNNTIKAATGYGIYVSSASQNLLEPLLIANNMISTSSSNSNCIYLHSCSYTNIYHNSLASFGNGWTLRLYYCSNYNVVNNIIAQYGSSEAFRIIAGDPITMDYNDIYSRYCYLGYDNTTYANLEAWQDATGFDMHSISVDPRFMGHHNLHTNFDLLANAGINLQSVIGTDIDGDIRISTPCIGADEFVPDPRTAVTGTVIVPTDYATISDAVNDIMSKGISGNVTISIKPGNYNEQIKIGELLYPSGTGSLTITSSTGNAEDVVITHNAVSASDNYVLSMDLANHLTIKGLTLVNQGQSYGQVILMNRKNNHITIENCTIEGGPYQSPSDRYSLIQSSNLAYGNLAITNNHFKNGSYGIKIDNIPSCGNLKKIIVEGNTFTNTWYRGISIRDCDTLSIKSNKISLGTYSSSIGIDVSYIAYQLNIKKNTITSATNKGLYLHSINLSPLDKGMVVNNMLQVTGNSGNALYVQNCSNLRFLHNSTSADGGSNSHAFHAYYSNQLIIEDNIFAALGTGKAVRIYNSSIDTMDYNNLFTSGSSLIYNGTDYANLADWQNATGFDMHSLSVDPQFKSSTDLHIRNQALIDAGTFVGVTTDIDGNVRSNPPDIGADEVSVDLAVTQIINPISGCLGVESIEAVIKNSGDVPDSNFMIHYRVNGSSIIQNLVSRRIDEKDTLHYRFTQPFDFSQAGNYTLEVWASTSNDGTPSNDTMVANPVSYVKPLAAFSYQNDCQLVPISFIDQSTIANGSIDSLKWDFGDGSIATGNMTSHAFNTYGNFNVSLVAVSDNGCTDTATNSLTVYPKPDASFTAPNVCEQDTVTFSNTTNSYQDSIVSYQWTLDDGYSSQLRSPKQAYSGSGFKNIELIVSSIHGCMDTATGKIEIYANPSAAFTFSGDSCSGKTISFNDQSSVGAGTITTQSWNFGDGGSGSGKSVSNIFASAGNYNVVLLVITDKGCTDSVSKIVSIFASPVVDFSAMDACLGDTVHFENNSTISQGTIISYMWDFGDNNSSIEVSPNHVYTADGNYTVELSATSDKNCVGSISKSIAINPLPPKPVIQKSGDTLLTQKGYTYQWYKDGNLFQGATDYFVIVSGYGTYSVEISNSNGCSSMSDGFVYTGIATIPGNWNITLFPNPVASILHLRIHGEKSLNGIAEITDVLGRSVKSLNLAKNVKIFDKSIDVSEMVQGTYFLIIRDDKGHVLLTEPFQIIR